MEIIIETIIIDKIWKLRIIFLEINPRISNKKCTCLKWKHKKKWEKMMLFFKINLTK